MAVTYLSREQWGADASLPRRGRVVDGASVFRGVFVHHTVFRVEDWDGDGIRHGDLDDIKAFMQRLQRIRPDLGYDVPYSYVVFAGTDPYSSVVCEGRGLGRTGAHTAGFNSTRLGVAVAGNTSDEPVTPGILEGIRYCGSLLQDQSTLNDTLPHRAVKATECPGSSMMAELHRVQPPFITPPIAAPQEDDDDMETLIDTTTGEGWVAANGKARVLGNVQAWTSSWTGPTKSSANMRHVIGDLYEIVS